MIVPPRGHEYFVPVDEEGRSIVSEYTWAVAQKKKTGGRVTPRGTGANSHQHNDHESVSGNSRYTPPIPRYVKQSPPWVPVLMFVLLGLGALVILLYYLGAVPGGRSNWYLASGLLMLLGGLYTATRYH